MRAGDSRNSFGSGSLSYAQRKKRRVDQFADYLRLMRLRRKRLGRNCFVVFSEDDPQSSTPPAERVQVAEVVFGVPPSMRLLYGWAILEEAGLFRHPPDEGEELSPDNFRGPLGGSRRDSDWGPVFGSGSSEPPRFIQFAFLQDRFYLELPKSTLAAAEARRLLSERHGFYWARQHRNYWWVAADWEAMLKWDPLQKLYIYRDEESAAEDMAFVLYDVWKCPLDQPWYIKAGCFHTAESFDTGKSLE